MAADALAGTFLTAQAAFTERVHAVAGDQWRHGTPDAQWTVADLVGHLVDEHRWAGPLLAGLDMDAARVVVARLGPAGGDGAALVRAWDLAAAASAEAFRADRALSGSVAITRGLAPAAEYLEEMVLDLIVHAWDLGTAIGYPGPLPAGPGRRRPDAGRHVRRAGGGRCRRAGHRPAGRADRPSPSLAAVGSVRSGP